PPGVGKTRLALAAADRLADVFPVAVAFVPLSSLADAALIPAAVAHVLGLEAAGRPPHAAIVDALCSRRALLVLDTFEHLLSAAPMVADLLASCPELKVLLTSRAPLRVRGEHELPVLPLTLPFPPPGSGEGTSRSTTTSRSGEQTASSRQPERARSGL